MRIFFTDALGNPIFGFRRRQQQLLHGGGGGGCGTSLVVMAQPPSNSEELAAWYYTDAPVRTTLFYYIMNRNWEWVLRRCRTHPHEVFQFDGRTGDTPLHACCRLNPPPQVVRALMSVTAAAVAAASTATTTTTTTTPVLRRFSFTSSSPSKQAAAAAAMTTLSSNFNNTATAASHHNNGSTCCQELVYNKDGWTALHVAASNHCSRQVLEVLVEYAPEAVSQLTRKTKRAPIHCATASFRGLDRDAFFYLLNVSLTRLVKDDSDDNNNDDDSSSENEYDIEDSDKINSSNGHKNTTKKLATGTNLLCLKDGTGQTPLALLFKKYRERVRHVCQQMDQLQLSRNDALELVQTELGTLWDKARSLVERLSAVLSSSESKAVTRHIKTASNKGSDQHHHHHHYDSDDDQSDIATTAAAMAAPMMAGALTASSPSSSLHNRIQQPTTSQHNRRSSHRRLSSILKFRSRSSLQGRRFRLVHASVGLIRFGCPPEMIRLAVSLYPHQVSEVDEDGNLPLHIAAMAFHEQAVATAEAEEMASLLDDASSLHTNSSHNNINNNYHIGSTSNNSSNWDTMSVISETTAASTLAGFSSNKSLWDQIFDMLLQQYPDAARTPQQQPAMATKSSNSKRRGGGGGGMIRSTPPPRPTYCSHDDTLPLVIAMRSCTHTMSWKRDGLERLMHAYAPALHLVLDGTTTVNTTQSATTKSLTTSSSSTCTSWHCYPHLFALLLAKDHENDHLLMSSGRSCSFRRFANGRRTTPLRPRSIRMDPSLRRRTPLDIARISAVYRLLQTKPEMIANHCWSNGKNSRAFNHSPAVASAATKGAQPTKTTKTPTKKSHPK